MSISIYDLCAKPGHFIGSRHLFLSLALDEKLTSSNASTWLVYTGTSKAFLLLLRIPAAVAFGALTKSPVKRRGQPSHPGCSAGRWYRDGPPAPGSSIQWHACSARNDSPAGAGVWNGSAGRRQRAPTPGNALH